MTPPKVTSFVPSDTEIQNGDDKTETKPFTEAQTAKKGDDDVVGDIIKDAIEKMGDETAEEAMDNSTTAQYSSLGATLLDDETQQGIVIRRAKQAVIHTAFTEMRIERMEKDLKQIKKDVYKLPIDFIVTKKQHHPVFNHVLQRSSPGDFKLSKAGMKIRPEQRPALEVEILEQIKPSAANPEELSPPRRTNTGLSEAQLNVYKSPQSLRVRPRPLLAHLQRVTRVQASDTLEPAKNALEQNAVLFLSPFKLFVNYEKEIRQSLVDLEIAVNELSDQSDSDDAAEGHKSPARNEKLFKDEDLLLDLKLLVQFLDEDLQPIFDMRKKLRDGTALDIDYQNLYHLFKRGDIVMVQSDRSHAYRVASFTGGREPLCDEIDKSIKPKPVDGFVLDLLSIRYDGSQYIAQLDHFSIRPFLGRLPISSLPVYPLKYDSNTDLEEELVAQGKRFVELTSSPWLHKHLRGKTLDEPSHDIDAQVIVDMKMAMSAVPRWKPSGKRITQNELTAADVRETKLTPYCGDQVHFEGCCGGDIAFKDLRLDDMDATKFLVQQNRSLQPRGHTELSREDLMLLPPHVHGFVLRNRQWVTMLTADLSEARFESGFQELMLPERHKSAIQALVNIHENSRTHANSTIGTGIDLVKGKGTGLIILLHGEPGVGKTSTAECVADDTKRPLFPITCGDIGETAVEVEKNLQYNFQLAHKWGCVLLLDEADVFLAKRNKTDLRRNAVTSVFLRSLEYYAGILFLTTNRVGSIDPAFKSRIHVSLFYPSFSLEQTRQLYEVYINRTREEQKRANVASFKIKEKEILKFARRHFKEMERDGLGTWNGRQIRNAFQAAIALVEYESQHTKDGDPKPALGAAQFQIIADSSKEFDRYLSSTLGAPEADIAHHEQWRYDRYGRAESTHAGSSQGKDSKAGKPYHTKASGIADTDSDDDDDDSSDDTSSDEEPKTKQQEKGKKSADEAVSSAKGGDSFEEYQQFLRWKNAQK
ncbi:hypothetical protein F5Y16DRAFT_398785 [Xylariaceae sp. FL0255]|nr:hypothetical protein F5Y16DRAFT_398785 [Xylariaceae sp. FL0255]